MIYKRKHSTLVAYETYKRIQVHNEFIGLSASFYVCKTSSNPHEPLLNPAFQTQPNFPYCIHRKIPTPLPFLLITCKRRHLCLLAPSIVVCPAPSWFPVLSVHIVTRHLSTCCKPHLRLCCILDRVGERSR